MINDGSEWLIGSQLIANNRELRMLHGFLTTDVSWMVLWLLNDG